MGAGGAPEPPHGARGWSGVPLTFLFDPRTSFLFGQRGCLLSPLECEPGSLGLGKVAGRAPEPLHGARGRSGVPLAFCTPLAREGLFAEPPSGASLGSGVSAYLHEEPLSLCTEREGRRVLSWLFIRLSRMRVCLLRPPLGRAWVAGPRHICRESSLASARS